MIGMAGGVGVCPTLLYDDAKAAIATLKDAFGFSEIAVYEGEDGRVLHAELGFGSGVVMLGSKGGEGAYAKVMAGAGPSSCYVAVAGGPPALDAHHARAAAHGVEILMEPTDQSYGSRDYMARDAEGNVWSFGTYAPEAAGGAGEG
ncbi:VOC family protein [Streptomyces sp. DW26H14]|uniref:VOC family protein n=1 Tax=Streptomyces sp. DW26H14 TaxID=3435395 RepID=UPI00403E1935